MWVLAGLSGSVPRLPHSVLCSFTLIREYCPAPLMTMSGAWRWLHFAWEDTPLCMTVCITIPFTGRSNYLGAAGARTGALVAFAILLMRRNAHNAQSVSVISDSLAKFATGRNGDCCSPDPGVRWSTICILLKVT